MNNIHGKVDEVLASCQGKGVKRALFSATLGPEVQELALSILRDPICIRVGQVSLFVDYMLLPTAEILYSILPALPGSCRGTYDFPEASVYRT